MLVEHRGMRPQVHDSAWVAPTAVLCGDVRVGPDARVLWNAVISGEDGRVELGARCVVMEHALVRGRAKHPVLVGDDVFPPDRHDDIWAVQEGLDFPGTVYGQERGDDLLARVMPRQTAWLAAHRDDRIL